MSLRDLHRSQAEGLRHQKRCEAVQASFTALAEAFAIHGIPQIRHLVDAMLKAKGVKTQWRMGLERDELLLIPGTKVSVTICVPGKASMDASTSEVGAHASDYYGPTFLGKISGDSLPGFPIRIVPTAKPRIGHSGFFWRGPSDNEKIATAIVDILHERRPAADYRAAYIWREGVGYTEDTMCFIASTVYAPSAPQLTVLKRFRDERISHWFYGRKFLRLYEYMSPPFA